MALMREVWEIILHNILHYSLLHNVSPGFHKIAVVAISCYFHHWKLGSLVPGWAPKLVSWEPFLPTCLARRGRSGQHGYRDLGLVMFVPENHWKSRGTPWEPPQIWWFKTWTIIFVHFDSSSFMFIHVHVHSFSFMFPICKTGSFRNLGFADWLADGFSRRSFTEPLRPTTLTWAWPLDPGSTEWTFTDCYQQASKYCKCHVMLLHSIT